MYPLYVFYTLRREWIGKKSITAWKVSNYGVFFWSVFSHIWAEYGEILSNCSITLSTILRIHLHDGKSKLWIFYQEHPDTFRKIILITINGKSRNGNHKNEMESNTFNNNDRKDNNIEENTEWYGLKPPYSPRQVKELIPFENELSWIN